MPLPLNLKIDRSAPTDFILAWEDVETGANDPTGLDIRLTVNLPTDIVLTPHHLGSSVASTDIVFRFTPAHAAQLKRATDFNVILFEANAPVFTIVRGTVEATGFSL